ncbi:MAG: heavy-metal-associated domain-containing protein [Thermaerobacter sp.]|jgi:copper chaperone|nr:heavy-metal-associated domain-containing protein [Thermaerobacter sp.]
MERTTLTVTGMTCGHCVNTITEALKGVAGVKVAKVTLETERAEVTYDPAQTSEEDLKAAVTAAGYSVA